MMAAPIQEPPPVMEKVVSNPRKFKSKLFSPGVA